MTLFLQVVVKRYVRSESSGKWESGIAPRVYFTHKGKAIWKQGVE